MLQTLITLEGKEHWLNRNEGWHTKKELWDGKRFAELSWFWDSNTTVLAADENEDGYHKVRCDCCHSTFHVQAKYVRGDPRNIAFVGELQWR